MSFSVPAFFSLINQNSKFSDGIFLKVNIVEEHGIENSEQSKLLQTRKITSISAAKFDIGLSI